MKTKKFLSLILAVLMVTTLFAGCTSQTSQPAPAEPDESQTETPAEEPKTDQILKFGATGFGGLFNPIMSDNVYDAYVTDIVFEKLVTNNSNGEMIPSIAEWTLSDDKLTYTFTLKDGIKFSDGSDLTTEDVAFTYETIAHPDYNGPRAYAVSSLVGYEQFHSGASDTFEGIKIIDDKTISFTFGEGLAAPANIESFVYGIMPSDYYAFETWEDFLALNEKPVGSGIMVFDSWEPKQFIKLMKNTNYWDPDNGAKIDGILMSEVPDESILSALQTNQIDFAQISSSAENLEAAQALTNISIANYLGNGYTFMCFNTIKPQLSDVRVRQALMYALDRESFIEAQYGAGLASVGMAPISPSSWAFPDSSELNAYKFDMDKAAQLMDEAGWTMGTDGFRYKDGEKFHVNWLVYTDSSWPGTLSGMAADTWKQLGVELEIELMDFDTVASRTMDAAPGEKNFDIYTMGFSLSIDPDPTGALFDDDAYVAGGFNASGYKNAEAMELVKAGKAEFDTAKRAEIYKEWAKIMNYEIPHVIIAYRSEIWGINSRVKGMDLGTYATWDQSLKNITLE
ncbi:MAG: ABC transporter substrate-binding protein [Sedimentibacter sp.]|uniref:ABC transporter substrate-binding protein n=1 Tax=Sedimentibacter sp. TaxID=1960295 RepID=UPI0029825FDA|nr:ABC transporter substrate-binding protein [Sedimentibacter sp.]MDW5298534.1 ABC transporter substrate-binding protein [Sedimentibacter sp.]